jgi:hypothetical protein
MDFMRKPIGHYLSWEGKYDLGFEDFQNYDVVVNENESGYRNEGVYIYCDNKIHNLSDYPDDYGCLPEWVELRKEDLGYSYFSDYLIDHNRYIPIKYSDWDMGKTYVEEEYYEPFKFYYKVVSFYTEFHRKKDGAKFTLQVPLVFGVGKLGGPIKHHKYIGGGCGNFESNTNYEYYDGEKFKLLYKYDNNYENKKMIEPYQSTKEMFVVSKENIDNGIKLVREKLKEFFEKNKIIYFECDGPCELFINTLPINGKYMNLTLPI